MDRCEARGAPMQRPIVPRAYASGMRAQPAAPRAVHDHCQPGHVAPPAGPPWMPLATPPLARTIQSATALNHDPGWLMDAQWNEIVIDDSVRSVG